MADSKWFRVATEGATTDGRKITREWLEQIARNYDPQRFGARVWLEHMRGLFPDGPFRAYGDVRAVRIEENDDGMMELYVQLDPTDALVRMNKERQKVYTSIEVDPEFADTGEAYLVGMGVTDSPASLGTEMLQFSARAKANPLMQRKQRPENVFTEAVEIALDFESESDEPNPGTGLVEKVRELFRQYRQAGRKDVAALSAEVEKTLGLVAEEHAALRRDLEARPTGDAFTELQTAHKELAQSFEQLHAHLDNTPDTPPRPTATGTAAGTETDC